MATYDEALQEAYASSPLDDESLDVDTLEMYHPQWMDDAGNPAPIFLAIGYGSSPGDTFQARLEADAPRYGGQIVSFIWAPVSVQRPAIGDGQMPQITLTFDNVDRRIVQHIELAQSDPQPISVIYRPYQLSDPSGPCMDPPIEMELTSVEATVFTVKAVAALDNLYNRPFPSEVYTPARFPGLVR